MEGDRKRIEGKRKGNLQQRSSCTWLLTTEAGFEGKALPTGLVVNQFSPLALWVSLRLKVNLAAWIQFSMPPVYESWVDPLTHCWNVSSPGQQTEQEPSPAVQDWPKCSAAEVHNTALAAFSVSQGAILPGSSQWIGQSSLKKKFCVTFLAWNDLYVELAYPSVDICPGSPDLAENVGSVFLLHQRGTFKASD